MIAAPNSPRAARAAGALALALALTFPFAAAGAAEPAPVIDYSGYQALLEQYTKVVSNPGEAIETVFDYSALRGDKDHPRRFAEIREQLFGVSPAKLDDRARLAWAINAYNYLALEGATRHLFEPTQRVNKGGRRYFFALRIATVNTIDADGFTFFEAPVVEVDGESYSLNAFARRFVFRGFDPQGGARPPAGLDPRAHFALTPPAKGAPSLLPRVYRADSLEQQLEFAVRNALANPRHLRFQLPVGRLEASSIFDWHKADFGGVDAAFAFLKKYAPPALRSEIQTRKVPWIAAYILWDWSLNHPEGGNEKPWELEEKQQQEGRSG